MHTTITTRKQGLVLAVTVIGALGIVLFARTTQESVATDVGVENNEFAAGETIIPTLVIKRGTDFILLLFATTSPEHTQLVHAALCRAIFFESGEVLPSIALASCQGEEIPTLASDTLWNTKDSEIWKRVRTGQITFSPLPALQSVGDWFGKAGGVIALPFSVSDGECAKLRDCETVTIREFVRQDDRKFVESRGIRFVSGIEVPIIEWPEATENGRELMKALLE